MRKGCRGAKGSPFDETHRNYKYASCIDHVQTMTPMMVFNVRSLYCLLCLLRRFHGMKVEPERWISLSPPTNKLGYCQCGKGPSWANHFWYLLVKAHCLRGLQPANDRATGAAPTPQTSCRLVSRIQPDRSKWRFQRVTWCQALVECSGCFQVLSLSLSIYSICIHLWHLSVHLYIIYI